MKTTGDLLENLKNVIKSTFKEEIDVFRVQRSISDMALIEKSVRNDSKYYFEELKDYVDDEILNVWIENYYNAKIAKLKSDHFEFVFFSYKILEGMINWWFDQGKGIKYCDENQLEYLEKYGRLPDWSKNKLFRRILVFPHMDKEKSKTDVDCKLIFHDLELFNFYKNLRDRYSHGTEISFKPIPNPQKIEKYEKLNEKYASFWDSILEAKRPILKKLYLEIENYNLATKQALTYYLLKNANK